MPSAAPEILLERVTLPPNATVPPPDNPDPASTLMEESASMLFVTPAAGILMVPVLLIGPPVRPAPVLMLVTVPPELGEALVSVTVPPNATVPPPDNPDPATTLMEESASMLFVTPAAGILMVPVLLIGPPVRPAPVLMLVTVPPELGEALVSVTVPPNATVPPPDIPDPASTLMEESASMLFVTPAAGILMVPVLLIGPPVRPAPVLMLVTVPPELGDALVSVTVPPNATVPPPDNPVPARTLMEESASMLFVTPAAGILMVPVLLIGPPVRPAPVLMLVTVATELGVALVSVTVPPNATVPPPDNPDPATTLMEESASMLFVTPAAGILMVPALVIGPPVKPAPVLMLATVPATGKVCPGAKVRIPFLAMESPVSLTSPLTPYSKLRVAPVFVESFPVGSACH